MTRALPLLLATGCNAFVGHPGKADVGQHDQDSGSCGACDDAPRPAAEGIADARCMAPRESVVDPFQLGVKAELLLPGVNAGGGAVTFQPIAVDVDGDGDREIALFEPDDLGVSAWLALFDPTGELVWTKPAYWWSLALAGADVDGHDGAEIVSTTCDFVAEEFDCENRRQAAISGDGAELWSIDEDDWRHQTAGIADLRGDGSPVLIHEDHVFDLATIQSAIAGQSPGLKRIALSSTYTSAARFSAVISS